MAKFKPEDYDRAYETVHSMTKELLAPPAVNWVHWEPIETADPRRIETPLWDGWEQVAIPAPYNNIASLKAWREGYCYYMDGNVQWWRNPYQGPPHGNRGKHYAWMLGFVTGIWTKPPDEETPDPNKVVPLSDCPVLLNQWEREVLRPLTWDGKACRVYDRVSKSWVYSLPEFKHKLLYPPVIWKDPHGTRPALQPKRPVRRKAPASRRVHQGAPKPSPSHLDIWNLGDPDRRV